STIDKCESTTRFAATPRITCSDRSRAIRPTEIYEFNGREPNRNRLPIQSKAQYCGYTRAAGSGCDGNQRLAELGGPSPALETSGRGHEPEMRYDSSGP